MTKKEEIQQQLIQLYENQIMDLMIMSKIELGDDVIAEIIRLKEELDDWDSTLMDGLEDEPPYVSDDFQIGPDGAYEHTEEYKTISIQKQLP